MQSVYWSDAQLDGKWQTTVLSSLQFAAKLHELWIGVSIAAIVSHFVVVLLARQRGLPFGLMGAGIQVGGLGFLTQRSFWSSFRCGNMGGKLRISLFMLSVVLCAVLNTLSGPASAIAMRPNLDWWLAPNETWRSQFAVKSDLWPLQLSVPQYWFGGPFNCSDYGSIDDSENFECPGSGWPVIQTWMDGASSTGERVSDKKDVNLTFTDPLSNTRRIMTSSMLTDGHSYTTSISMIPHMAMAFSFQNISNSESHISQPKLASDPTTLLNQPVVQVNCNIYAQSNVSSASTGTENLPHFPPNMSIAAQSLPGNNELGILVPIGIWNHTNDKRLVNVSWVDLYSDHNQSASIGVVFMLPYSTTQSHSTNALQDQLIVPCTLDARWVRSQVSFDSASSDTLKSQFSDVEGFSKLGAAILAGGTHQNKQSGPIFSDLINIDLTWASLVNVVSPTSQEYWNTTAAVPISLSSESNATVVERYFRPTLLSGQNNIITFGWFHINKPPFIPTLSDIQSIVSMLCGMVMTNGLSRYGTDSVFFNNTLFRMQTPLTKIGSSSPASKSPNGFLQWDFQVWRWGYSYGARNITTKLSLALLLAHAAFALGFMVYLCFAGWRTSAWSSIGELIALALKSQPTQQFQGTDAGISRSKTWAQNVRIREMENGGLQMRFGEDGCDEDRWEPVESVGLGKRYGNEEKVAKTSDMEKIEYF